jgi:hypothetical protein
VSLTAALFSWLRLADDWLFTFGIVLIIIQAGRFPSAPSLLRNQAPDLRALF